MAEKENQKNLSSCPLLSEFEGELPGLLFRNARWLNIADLAHYLRISKRTIYNRIGKNAKNPFPVRPRRSGGMILFDRKEIDAWVESWNR